MKAIASWTGWTTSARTPDSASPHIDSVSRTPRMTGASSFGLAVPRPRAGRCHFLARGRFPVPLGLKMAGLRPPFDGRQPPLRRPHGRP
jgi:hypothetical protein